MSLLAGVVALGGGEAATDGRARAFIDAVSREPGDRPRVHRAAHLAIAQWLLPCETQACEYRDAAGNLTLMAGRPLFDPTPGPSEIEALHGALVDGSSALLERARGSYAAVHWSAASKACVLVADKLGLRPLYYGIEDGVLYVASALRIFEAARVLTGRMDVRGVAELAAFGYPLSARSPYAGIRTIEAGEIVRIDAAGLTSRHYWRWDRLPEAGIAQEDLPRVLHDGFVDAVARRLEGERAVVAGLSGGLDSRCVVAGLQACGVDVHTINFAPSGSEDLVFGRLAAEAMGTRHFECSSGPLEFWDRQRAAVEAWRQASSDAVSSGVGQRLWSGDGGSCALGHIYLTDDIIALMRRGDSDAAIESYLKYNRIALPRRALVREARDQVADYPRAGVQTELDRLGAATPTRRLHLYLMINGQRRLLAKHYENLDRRRFEVVTPFFDAEFLRLVLGSPIEGFMHHRFYHRWLDEFAAPVTTVPWQAYPGHVPCPLPRPEGLRNQWDSWYEASEDRELARRDARLADELLRDPRLPRDLFDRRVLWLARCLTRLHVGDYSHVFKCAATFVRYSPAN